MSSSSSSESGFEIKYHTFEEIKQKINEGYSIDRCYYKWFSALEITFDYLDQQEYYEDAKSFVHDMVNTLNKHINLKKTESLIDIDSKL